MSILKQILYKKALQNKDIIYACGINAAKLALPSDKLFLWTDYDQVIIEFDCQPQSVNTNNGRLLGTFGTSRNFTVATVSNSFYWLFSDISWSTYSTSSVYYAGEKSKFRFVFDIANHQILLTKTVASTEVVTNYTKSVGSTVFNNLGTEALTIGGHGSTNTGNTVYIWKNSMLIQKVKNGVTENVLVGKRAVPGVDYIVDGATPVEL